MGPCPIVRASPTRTTSRPGAIPESIPVATTFDFPDWKVERYVGACFGLIVRSMGAVVLVVAAMVGNAGMRRHGESAVADGWDRTGEMFRDPPTGRITRVWLDPVDGTRHYVPDPGAR